MEGDRRELEERLAIALAAEPLVAAAYLYGSRARERSTPLSDVDVAVLPQGGLASVDRDRLLHRLLVELGRAAPEAAVEVRFLDELPIAIAKMRFRRRTTSSPRRGCVHRAAVCTRSPARTSVTCASSHGSC